MSPTEDRPPSPDLPPPAEVHGGDSAVRRINPLEDLHWDARLAGWPAASFFHSLAWARVLHSTYGFSPVYFTLGEPSHPSALLPFMEVDSWLTGRRGVALPFTDECEPLCRDADSFRRLFGEALEYAKVRAWKYLESRGGKAWFGDVPASNSFYGHRLDLRAGEKALFAGIESAGRRAVRKAEQSDLSVEFSQSRESIRAFHGLLCKTRKRHGVPPQPFVFFANIQRHVLAQNQGWVVLARHGGIPVAGAVFFHSGTTALYKFGASDEKYQNLRGNNLVIWAAIKRYAQQGFEVMRFGRTATENAGLRRFKLHWGAQEYRIDYVTYDLRAQSFVSGSDDFSGWYTRVIRLLPTPVSRLIGAALYRHVA